MTQPCLDSARASWLGSPGTSVRMDRGTSADEEGNCRTGERELRVEAQRLRACAYRASAGATRSGASVPELAERQYDEYGNQLGAGIQSGIGWRPTGRRRTVQESSQSYGTEHGLPPPWLPRPRLLCYAGGGRRDLQKSGIAFWRRNAGDSREFRDTAGLAEEADREYSRQAPICLSAIRRRPCERLNRSPPSREVVTSRRHRFFEEIEPVPKLL